MLSDRLVGAAVAVAKRDGVRPAGFLALIEVETNGQPFEPDGATPRFLPERHKFFSELKAHAPGKLPKAVAAGLAIPKWSPKTQYKDLRSDEGRKAVFARMVAIDAECAHRACSWGLGQIMGFEAEHLGYPNAIEMVRTMRASPEAQLEAIARFLKSKKIVAALNAGDHCTVGSSCHNYADVALRYNGEQYAQHNYDGRLADADKRWTRKLAAMGVNPAPDAPSEPTRPVPPEQLLSRAQIQELQARLRTLNYAEAGMADGVWDTKTTAAIAAFQAHEGLTVTGSYDDATEAALLLAQPRPVPRERSTVTEDDLRDEGSRTIKTADKLSLLGKIKLWLFGAPAVGGIANESGVLDQAKELGEKAGTLHETITSLQGFLPSWRVIEICIAIALLGAAIVYLAGRIKKWRVADHHSGVHAGAGA
ncbi:MAG: DUF3380 domain-containing protein [Alphaproteobacteria bacterium]|nr:MAG: DUF3380 domain-containing protein [Alphaproteobacteria bacterium]